jgi:hypothetical protein
MSSSTHGSGHDLLRHDRQFSQRLVRVLSAPDIGLSHAAEPNVRKKR